MSGKYGSENHIRLTQNEKTDWSKPLSPHSIKPRAIADFGATGLNWNWMQEAARASRCEALVDLCDGLHRELKFLHEDREAAEHTESATDRAHLTGECDTKIDEIKCRITQVAHSLSYSLRHCVAHLHHSRYLMRPHCLIHCLTTSLACTSMHGTYLSLRVLAQFKDLWLQMTHLRERISFTFNCVHSIPVL